jgi:hypothetical protein
MSIQVAKGRYSKGNHCVFLSVKRVRVRENSIEVSHEVIDLRLDLSRRFFEVFVLHTLVRLLNGDVLG